MDALKTRIETPVWRQCVVFYTEVLGMTVRASWDGPDDKVVILALGEASPGEPLLEFARSETPGSYAGLSLQFGVRDLAAVAERLHGRVVFEGPVDGPWR